MKQRLLWVDIAKGLAILSVLIGHTIPDYTFFNKIIFSFHMPIFFILSSYVTNYGKEMNSFFLGKMKVLLLPYFFSIIFDVIDWLIIGRGITKDSNSFINLFKYISKQFAIGLGQNCSWTGINPVGVLWFIPCLFLAEFLFYFLLKFSKDNNELLAFSSLAVSLLGYFIGNHCFLVWSLDIAFVAQIFLFIGYYWKQKQTFIDTDYKRDSFEIKCALYIIWLICILTSPISMNNRDYSYYILPVLGAISGSYLVILFSMQMEKIRYISNFLQYCGKYSLIILIFHVRDAGTLHLNMINSLSFLYSNQYCILLILYRLVFSIAMIEILKRIPYVKQIYSLD